MVNVVKSCDYTGEVAATVFELLNNTVDYDVCDNVIITDTSPEHLNYPEGWYYSKGYFRNKHNSTSGIYTEIPMLTTTQKFWGDLCKECIPQ